MNKKLARVSYHLAGAFYALILIACLVMAMHTMNNPEILQDWISTFFQSLRERSCG